MSAENEPGIGAEALEKMLSWRFVPATRRGRKVPELLVMTIKMGNVFDWEYREPQDRQR